MGLEHRLPQQEPTDITEPPSHPSPAPRHPLNELSSVSAMLKLSCKREIDEKKVDDNQRNRRVGPRNGCYGEFV
jgi:hypothetical protein